MYILAETTFGNFKIRLFKERAPATVKNFVDLASGNKVYINHKTGQPAKSPFYDGLIFHRVIKDFLVQSGCPYGDGSGGPGYFFDDEIDISNNKHDRPGLVSMANFAPNTNGSQFFITLSPIPWLDKSHTIFGEVTEGLENIINMANTIKTTGDRPDNPPKIIKLTVIET